MLGYHHPSTVEHCKCDLEPRHAGVGSATVLGHVMCVLLLLKLALWKHTGTSMAHTVSS
jgi:hypothetical protein